MRSDLKKTRLLHNGNVEKHLIRNFLGNGRVRVNVLIIFKIHLIISVKGNIGVLAEEMARTCTPKRHIVFLKKHKCASSTIYEILNRFKKKHKLFAASKPIGIFSARFLDVPE